MGNDSKGWLRGAFLLTVAGLISKVFSAGYRIPLQNLTGDIGFYIYQQVYPLLGIALVLSLYGFPAAISKITADAKRKKHVIGWKNFYLPLLLILLVLMGGLAALLFFFADRIAVGIGDPELTRIYRFAAVSLLLVPFTSLLRGVFQGNLQMKPTAYSQVGEQLIRVMIIIIVAMYVSFQDASIYRIGEGAVVASISGGVVALFILLTFFKRERQVLHEATPIPWRYYFQTIILFGLVAALNHMVLLLFQLADAFTLISGLQQFGLLQDEAMEAKGVLDRGQPLIQLGTVLGSSFALAMIPSLSREKLETNPEELYHHIRSSVKVGFYLAVGATFGLIAIMPEANILLFQDLKGTEDLRILVIAVVLSALGITSATILQGLGWIKRTAVFILIGVFVKWCGNIFLVPLLGITGSVVATVLGLGVFAFLVLFELRRKLPDLRLAREVKWTTLLLATFFMLLYIFVINQFIPGDLSRIGALFYVGFIAITGAAIYIFILLRGGAFISREISMLPFGHILKRIHKERD